MIPFFDFDIDSKAVVLIATETAIMLWDLKNKKYLNTEYLHGKLMPHEFDCEQC